ncbi:MAG TPA: filamentous hemagglutinin N-terminal domain-containing protein, partial [Xenococcaceae cyanobacterium]
MAFKLTDRFNSCQLWSFPLALISLVGIRAIASAQIIPDNTLPQNSIVAPNGDIIEITGGTRAGNNLFHSFEQFSILNGQTAFFDNTATITNIIGRVTGNFISEIDGLIQANGTTNLFLLNPNGVIFGSNAALDIGGSFVGSTANSIEFADGSQFSVNPQETPLLTVSIPIGLQYGSNTGSITVEGGGNNLVLNQDFSIDRSNRPNGLKVADGETLALVGDEIEISGGNITAAAGNIELWAVNDGLVSLVNSDGQLQIEAGQEQLTYGNIELAQAASIDASGNSGGEIQLQGKNITVQDGSVILTDTLGNGSGGSLSVKSTESITVTGISAFSPIFSGILADVAPEATGSGGNVTIETNSLQISDGGQISSGTFGIGNAGSLTVTSQNIKISGGSFFGPSGLFTPVALGARGNGGDLSIETNSLEIMDAGQISSGTFGFGNGGNLTIKANEIDLSGGNEFAPSTIDTTVFKIPGIPEEIVPFLGAGFGNGGNLTIETNSLRVSDGAQIAVSTSGIGQAGNLAINAENVELLGFNELGRSGLFASAIIESGDGGDINLKSDRLSLRDGATISGSNFASRNSDIPPGTGTAGNIKIDVNSLKLDSTIAEDFSSITASTNSQAGGDITLNVNADLVVTNNSQITSDTKGEGAGGNITLTADTLKLSRGGLLSTNTSASGNGGTINLSVNTANFSDAGSGVFSEVTDTATGDGGSVNILANQFTLDKQAQISVSSVGLGQAGNIQLESDRLQTNQGLITATSAQTGGGNIAITTDFIQLQNNSLISTSVLDSSGGGGNIVIASDVVLANHNSDIRANAVLGAGGNINIETEVIFTSPSSEIDASSEFGLDGVVEINNPDPEKQFGLTSLPDKISDPTRLILANCPVDRDNVMAVVGKGGLPDNPHQSLRGQSIWQDLRLTNNSVSEGVEINNNSAASRIQPIQKTQIIEAKDWIINDKGN